LVQEVEIEDGGVRCADYDMIGAAGKPAAGVCHARGSNLGLPRAWMICLDVGDLAESLRRVREGGGTIIEETRGANGEAAFAAIHDPVGGAWLWPRNRPGSVQRTPVMPSPKHHPVGSRDDRVTGVQKIMDPDTPERDRSLYPGFMSRNTPHPAVSDLIHRPGHDGAVTAEGVVDQALVREPIVPAPPETTTGE
jgi:hypothetical protein